MRKKGRPAMPQSLLDLQREHPVSPRRLVADHEAAEENGFRNYIRDLVLGVNDGIVSVYALVAGVAAAGFGARAVAAAGVAAAIAGALSMGLGEYISTKSQAQYYAAEARREREHVRQFPQLERQELKQMLLEKTYPPALVDDLVEHLSQSEDRFVDFMMREEFGVGKESDRSAVWAMLLIMGAFLAGSVLPVFPYFLAAGRAALIGASVLSIGGLFVAGAAKGRVSGLNPWRSGAEMAVLGSIAAVVTYYVGYLFHVAA